MQMDLKGWGVGYVSSFQQHCLLHMLNSVAGLREYFAQTDDRTAPPRIPVMVNMASSSVTTKKIQNIQLNSDHNRSQSLDNAAKMMDEYSDDDEDFQIPDEEAYHAEQEARRTAFEEEPVVEIDLSCFLGNLRRDDNENSRDC